MSIRTSTSALLASSVIALSGMCVMSGTASAATIVYEPFDYPETTALATQSPDGGAHTWAKADTANAPTDQAVTAGSLTAPSGFPASTGNKITYGAGTTSDRINTGTINSGSAYYSFLLNVSDLGTLPSVGPGHSQILAGFNNSTGTQTGNPTSISSTLWVAAGGGTSTAGGTDTTDLQLGMSVNSGTTTRTFDTTTYPLSHTLLVVGAFDYGADTTYANATSRLWIYDVTNGDAVPASEPTAELTVPGTGLANSVTLASFLLYSTSATTANRLGTDGVNVDEVRVGTSWVDVVPVPEPATGALIALSSLGLLSLRQRRR